MSEFTNILNLDAEAVDKLSTMHYGYARALRENQPTQNIEYMASSFLISAILTSLIRPYHSKERFLLASAAYRESKNPYWKVLAVCGMNPRSLIQQNEFLIDNDLYNNSDLYDFISLQFLATVPHYKFERPYKREASAKPFGRLLIPLTFYEQAFQSIENLQPRYASTELKDLLEPWERFLNRASEKVKSQMEDSYHWQKLRGGIIPLEPEILASCICFCLQAKKNDLQFSDITESLDVDQIAILPLKIADAIVNPKISGG